MFKYYWDQTIYFNLFQSAPNQPPVILQRVKGLITLHQDNKKDFKPIVYNKAEKEIKNKYLNEYEEAIKDSVRNIKDNVGPFFLNLKPKTFSFYVLIKN